MPTYRFKDTTTGEEFDAFMSWSERVDYLAENSHIQPCVTAPAIVSGVGNTKVDDGFKSLLKKVSKDAPRNNMNIT